MRASELRELLSSVRDGSLSIDAALAQLGPGEQPPPGAASSAGEFDRVAELSRLFAATGDAAEAVQLGIGDDAAILQPQAAPWVFSVDVAVEHVHFERRFASWEQIGGRAFTAAISDLAAMGARPLAALCSLILPAGFPDLDFSALNRGLAGSATRYACPVIGGNLSSGREVSITTTVIGLLQSRGLLRSGARPGDAVYVTGPLGSAALGLQLLLRAETQRGASFIDAWRLPTARLDAGLLLAPWASAAVDVSDGALQDVGHIAAASSVAIELESARIPSAPGFTELTRELGLDPLTLALLGGEDYELIYTLPPHVAVGPGTCIGRVLAGTPDVRVVDSQGDALSLLGRGYRHF
ncbi:MAG: thiamine-phosphate kinase [Polyangiales bacterium]